MNLGIDVMGGDFAPGAVMEGVALALHELPSEVILWLFGASEIIMMGLANHGVDHSRVQLVATEQVIAMGEHPMRALARAPKSSIAVGMTALAQGQIDAFVSAGNTGAMFVAGLQLIGPLPGISRPSMATLVPKPSGRNGLILDVGANADCKPDHLVQFAQLGDHYARTVLGYDNPTIGLINIGEEAEKGSLMAQATHKLLAETPELNFVGNVETRDLYTDKADVVVCDGFVGNIIIKQAEAMYTLVKERGISDSYFEQFNYERHGGSPILGLNKPVLVGHGISNAVAIKNMLIHGSQIVGSRMYETLRAALS